MLKKIINLISVYRYKFKKLIVKLDRPQPKNLNSIQQKVIKIVTDILLDPKTELQTNPLDNKFYLKKIDNKMHIFIIIYIEETSYNVNISGKNFVSKNIIEKFNYDVYIPSSIGRQIVNKFNKKLKRIVTKIETDLIKENEDNLSDLIVSLKK